jgi:hypothetical protein
MKLSPEMDPAAAFPDPKQAPVETDLRAALGVAFAPIDQILTGLRSAHPNVTGAWQFSARVGWYYVQLLAKRRLLYLVPRRRDFRLSIILGGKALAALKAGPFRARLAKLLKAARRYPEGTAFTFEGTSTDPELFAAMLEAKISPEVRA